MHRPGERQVGYGTCDAQPFAADCQQESAVRFVRNLAPDTPGLQTLGQQPTDVIGNAGTHSIGPAMISSNILRFKYVPAPSRPRYRPSSTTTCPRRIVTVGQANIS